MNDQQQLALLKIREKVDRHLAADLSPAVRDFLLAELVNCSSVKSAVIGNMSLPTIETVIGEAWATPGGVRLREVLDESDAHRKTQAQTDQEAELARIRAIENDAKRMNESRRTGVGMPEPRL